MSLLRNIVSGLRGLFRKERVERELDEELNGFLELAIEEKRKQGMSGKEAVRAVRLERGGLDSTKEEVRAAGWESVVDALCPIRRVLLAGSPFCPSLNLFWRHRGVACRHRTLRHARLSRRAPYCGIGVRMALGAQRRQLLWMILRESLLVSAAAILAGVPLAIAGSRLMRSMLFGVQPGDLLSFMLALFGVILVALAASIIPARRAAALDPIVALRYE